MQFRDRTDAGRFLAGKLMKFANRPDVLVLALPRGGVPVAIEIARALHVPLDIFVVRKLGLPGLEELAMGAIASGGARVVDEEIVRALGISTHTIEAVTADEEWELERRERAYRVGRPTLNVRDRTILLIDDGLATGSTMRAAVAALREQAPARAVIAVPVGASDTCAELRRVADEVVCGSMPDPFYAISASYCEFPQLTDQEVHDLLEDAAQEHLTAC